jgi:glycosyltransferase involved in cell wall biosynthesis
MRATLRRAVRGIETGARWVRLLRPPSDGALRVSYGLPDVPAELAVASGGTAKLQKLARRFSSQPDDFTLLYLSSSALPRDLRALLWLARRRGAPVVLNQDGVGYAAWAGARWESVNRPLRAALLVADHVLYQSGFCKDDADRYLGAPAATWEILHNAVDCERFAPPAKTAGEGPVLLLAGNQTSPGRLELALDVLGQVRHTHADARLLVAGRVLGGHHARLAELVEAGAVELTGPYTQAEAPSLYARAHVLLHTKVLDPCPNVVLEGLACGLPVVYPRSGGTPELVGEAGVGVDHVISHEVLSLPAPEAFADAVDTALRHRDRLSALARARAVEHFALEPWLDRHAQLFDELRSRALRPAR